ncbi:MAG TPA: Nif3-like dinuclear metal center hexameric protein [Candidatus Kapabacteria bacterium]|nr:Nif3-like dinuclear metal center hexameric protein [Candidatus Kapabacteria bacterium]HOV92017.1 Nif3-like dinuclear metal center hexameric protein [Candidatus Kapabacteria bacterium]
MNIYNLLDFLEVHFPARFAMKNDKFGLEIQISSFEIDNILVCYEINEQIIEEAKTLDCQLILTYHPLIYFPIERLYFWEHPGKLLTMIIDSKISVISLHTRFDTYQYGSNYLFAKALGLEIDKFLEPNNENNEYGMGIIGHFNNDISSEEFLEKIQNITQSIIKYTEGSSNFVYKIGIVVGSGKEYLKQAIEKGLDGFITSDVSYHYFHTAKNRIWLIDAGHSETERFIAPAIAEFLKHNINDEKINIHLSQINTNPIKYYNIK